MHAIVKMRDRRNTNLSTFSTSSNDSYFSESPSMSPTEKRSPSPQLLPSALPSPLTKENYSKRNLRSRIIMGIRLLGTLCGIIALWQLISTRSFGTLSLQLFMTETTHKDADFIELPIIPDEPSASTIMDLRGHIKWTVSIPQDYNFPLQHQHARDICRQSDVFRDSLSRHSRMAKVKDWRRKNAYYSEDRHFLDVGEAERDGPLLHSSAQKSSEICEKSLTVSLDAADSSFGKSLLMLWLSYGLAQKEGRAFFIDDSRWTYGRYTSYFAPPPNPGCARPPQHHILPCPHQAKHLLISSATLPWTFGHSFDREFQQLRKTGVEKNRQIYDLLRAGYRDLFKLSGEDALYSASRIAKFKEEAHQRSGSVVGIHLRRGDLHPFEYQFSEDYLPLERYGTAARKLLRSQLQVSLPEKHSDADDFQATTEYVHSPVLLATDDPETFDSAELRQSVSPFEIQKAQERIQLATKATLDRTSPAEPIREPGSAYTKHVEENSGWEGGFYSPLLYSLGKTGDLSSEQAMRMRNLVGRAYLLDLAVLGESDGVVCAISSATCRVLGVMMGWDAVKEGKWKNVDDNRAWAWDSRRR